MSLLKVTRNQIKFFGKKMRSDEQTKINSIVSMAFDDRRIAKTLTEAYYDWS